MLDIFNSDAFGVRRLTDSVLKLPFLPGQLGTLGIFDERGVTTDKIAIEERDGVLDLITTTPRGGVSQQLKVNKGTIRPFKIPSLKLNSTINADEVQGVRAFGAEDELKMVQDTVNQRMSDLFGNHDATLEFQRMGAVKGIIYDADGSTALLNLFTEFGVSQETEIAFDLTAGSPSDGAVIKKCNALIRTMQGNLGATPVTRVKAFCSATFWDDFTTNKEVRDSFRSFQDMSYLRQANVYNAFTWGGIDWEEYRGSINGVDFVAADKAIFFPMVRGLYRTYFAPADFMETVNTIGLPRYAKQAPDPDGLNRFRLLHTQSNPLSLCLRPKVLMLGKRGA